MYPVLARFWNGRKVILWRETAGAAVLLSMRVGRSSKVRYALDCGHSDSMVFCESDSWKDHAKAVTITHRGDAA